MTERIVIGMTGATGQRYGIRLLELLEETEYEVHLVVSSAADLNITHESKHAVADVKALADVVHSNRNIGAKIASGSFNTEGMIIAPCSMKTLSNIAHGNSGNLMTRAADVVLKERRPLVLLPREKPFNRIHLKNMLEVTDAGGIIMPPFPSFYNQPKSIDEMITRTTARTLSLLNVEIEIDEWEGISESVPNSESER